MKFSASSIVSALALAASCNAAAIPSEDTSSSSNVNVTLRIESSYDDISGMAVTSLHEGAGINYLFATPVENAETYTYDGDHLFIPTDNGIYQGLGDSSGYLMFGPGKGNAEVTFDQDYLTLNGSVNSFFACHNTSDPYNYSEKAFQISLDASYVDTEYYMDCVEVYLHGVFA